MSTFAPNPGSAALAEKILQAGSGLTSTRVGPTITFSLGSPVSVAHGGTGDNTLTAHAVLLGEGASPIAFAAPSSTTGWLLTSNGASSDPSFQAPPAGGAGTVTSITAGTGLTGGTITTSGTIALAVPVTVADGGTGITTGTSGGIPYFSSTTAIASSALLGLNDIVLGGGAGAAPTATSVFSYNGSLLLLNQNTDSSPNLPSPLTVGMKLIAPDTTGVEESIITFAGSGTRSVYQSAGTASSPTALASNTIIHSIIAAGYDGTAWSGAQASLQELNSNAWTTTDHSTRFRFLTTPSGSTTLTQVVAINMDGTLYVGATNNVTTKNTGAGTVNVDTGYFVAGTNVTPGQLAVFNSGGQSPTGTASTTLVMMGLGTASFGTNALTPKITTRVYYNINGTITLTAAGGTATVQLRYNSGSAPSNGAAATGNIISVTKYISAGAALDVPFSLEGIVTGLTAGTKYWWDLAMSTSATTNTTNALTVNSVAFEL